MDALQEFLEAVAKHHLAEANFRGLLHALVGRKITKADDSPVSTGLTWREAAALLRRLRWDVEVVQELGVKPDDLPPKDRERYWYSAIARANIDSPEASQLADKLADRVKKHGYRILPASAQKASERRGVG